MIRRCTPSRIKERMAASSCHTVRVQNARSASRRTETARLPAARLAWACRANSLDREHWHVPPRPNSKAGDGHEGHEFNDLPSPDQSNLPLAVVYAGADRRQLAAAEPTQRVAPPTARRVDPRVARPAAVSDLDEALRRVRLPGTRSDMRWEGSWPHPAGSPNPW